MTPLAKFSTSISIHAPRGGSDSTVMIGDAKPPNFNPRSPWGERLQLFLAFRHGVPISIHAPRGGSDN